MTPEHGETWPWVVLNHAGRSPKDALFFDGFVEPLVGRGFAVCRYDPRELHGSFWSRWSDLSAVIQHVSRDYRVNRLALAGSGLGAVLSLWWAKVHASDAVVCFGLPAPAKLGAVPRAMHDHLPPGLAENALVPHPAQVATALVLIGERDTEAPARAESLGAAIDVIPGGDKSFSGVRPRQAAFERAAAWLAATIKQPAHERPEEVEGLEAPPNEAQTGFD